MEVLDDEDISFTCTWSIQKIFLNSNIAKEITRSLVSPCMQHLQTPSLQILQC